MKTDGQIPDHCTVLVIIPRDTEQTHVYITEIQNIINAEINEVYDYTLSLQFFDTHALISQTA